MIDKIKIYKITLKLSFLKNLFKDCLFFIIILLFIFFSLLFKYTHILISILKSNLIIKNFILL